MFGRNSNNMEVLIWNLGKNIGIAPKGQSYGYTEGGIGVGFEIDQPIWRKV